MDHRKRQLKIREELLTALHAQQAHERSNGDAVRVRTMIEVTMFGVVYLVSDSQLSTECGGKPFLMDDLHTMMMTASGDAADQVIQGLKEDMNGTEDTESEAE